METVEGSKKATSEILGSEFFLQWGSKKRLRYVRVRDPQIVSQKPDDSIRMKFTSKIDRFVISSPINEDTLHPLSSRFSGSLDAATLRSSGAGNRKSSSPEKEDRCYTTRGSADVVDYRKFSLDGGHRESNSRGFPKLYIALSSKEKEEDFMAMKGCKLPQRPKKRAKLVQRSLLSMSPGAWLADMCEERYEVREKKRSKKRPGGLKAMGKLETDSE